MAQRSAANPISTLKESIKFVQPIYETYNKRDYNPAEIICETVFGKAYPTLKQKFSTACQYGLLDMKAKIGYKVTDLFEAIHIPKNDKEKEQATLKALILPPLYQKIINHYNNSVLPAPNGLRALFIRDYAITSSAADRAVKVLYDNFKEFGILRNNNYLSTQIKDDKNLPGSDPDGENVDNGNGDSNGSGAMENDFKPPMGKSKEIIYRETIPIFLDENRTAYLKIPVDFNEADLKQLTGFIEFAVKPIIKKTNA